MCIVVLIKIKIHFSRKRKPKDANNYVKVWCAVADTKMCCLCVLFKIIRFFTIGQSDAFLSDYLTDLKLHSTNKFCQKFHSGV